MRHRRSRRFRHSSNGRGFHSRRNGGDHVRINTNSFSNDRKRNNFNSNQNAEKLFDKYKILAKEALSSGDKILSENYLQHADHFKRIIDEKNLNKAQATQEIKQPDNLSTENVEKSENQIEEKPLVEKKE
tara:strand:+ start:145 stop:534 length:390 start_codon:yes stop_codon:yes gene_type:complete